MTDPSKETSPPQKADRTSTPLAERLSLKAAGKVKKGFEKVGWGEFEPADRTRAINFMRYLFLEQVRSMELAERSWRSDRKRLKVLEELAGTPLKEFEKADVSNAQVLKFFDDPFARFERKLRALQESVRSWSQRWHMESPWCLGHAVSTLRLWRDYPRARESWLWDNNFPLDESTLTLTPEMAGTPPFEGVPPFYAHIEQRSVYERRARMLISRHLRTNPFTARLDPKLRMSAIKADMVVVKGYCDKVMEAYERRHDGRGAPVWKRVAERAALQRDLRWAVEFQVRGTAAKRIAEEEGREKNLRGDERSLSHTTVRQAVDYVLNLIGLPVRSDARRGRPRSDKKSGGDKDD